MYEGGKFKTGVPRPDHHISDLSTVGNVDLELPL